MDLTEFNRKAWDAIANSHRKWFTPASEEQINAAKVGEISIRLTATKNVPRDWLGDVTDKRILCLAAGGGHQGPILAAAGAKVTVADFSEAQLAIDQSVAKAAGLHLETVQCDMRQLDTRNDFEIVINPCSTNFCSDVPKVWSEAFRVLKPGGILMTGVINPINYLFNAEELLNGKFEVQHSIPYKEQVDWGKLDDPACPPTPAEFGHSLQDLIGAQMSAGFRLTDFYEDRWGAGDMLSRYIPVFIATRAVKPS